MNKSQNSPIVVYVLHWILVSDCKILGVYSTREEAEKRVNKNSCAIYSIEEYILDR